MALIWRRRVPLGRDAWLNLGRRGVSASRRAVRLTISSTGRISVRIARGVYWTLSGRRRG
jgi:hypothetical protein